MALRTWIKVVLILVGLCLLAMLALAGAGVYFVSQHIDTRQVTSPEAGRAFDAEVAKFKDQKPLIEIDRYERPHANRRLSDLPTSTTKIENMVVMAYDPDEDRIVTVKIPVWILRMGRHKVDFGLGNRDFDLERLDLDVKLLERVGPQLVLNLRSSSGERVLIWTQ